MTAMTTTSARAQRLRTGFAVLAALLLVLAAWSAVASHLHAESAAMHGASHEASAPHAMVADAPTLAPTCVSCGTNDGSAVVACVLAIVVAVLLSLAPPARVAPVSRVPVTRADAPLPRVVAPAAPSLVSLCISRT